MKQFSIRENHLFRKPDKQGSNKERRLLVKSMSFAITRSPTQKSKTHFKEKAQPRGILSLKENRESAEKTGQTRRREAYINV